MALPPNYLTQVLDTPALVKDVLFRAGEPEGAFSEFYARALDYLNRAELTIASGAQEFGPDLTWPWRWHKAVNPAVIILEPAWGANVAVTHGSLTATITSPPTGAIRDLTGEMFTAPALAAWPRVAALDLTRTIITWDAPWVDVTTTVTGAFWRLDYQLPPDVIRVLDPVRAFQQGSSNIGRCKEVTGIDRLQMERQWPLRSVSVGPPEAYAVIAERTLRFNRPAHAPFRLEADYMQVPPILYDAPDSVPREPVEYRHVLADIATYFLLVDKDDGRAQGQGQAVMARLQAMKRREQTMGTQIASDYGALQTRRMMGRGYGYGIGSTVEGGGGSGPAGPPGPQGPQGEVGATGPQGATGATGAQGLQGEPGTPGEDWQIAAEAKGDLLVGAAPADTQLLSLGTAGQVLTADATQPLGVRWGDPVPGPEGPAGPGGPPGLAGPQGTPGVGVPAGGTEDQVLAKASDTDYDTVWVPPPVSDVLWQGTDPPVDPAIELWADTDDPGQGFTWPARMPNNTFLETYQAGGTTVQPLIGMTNQNVLSIAPGLGTFGVVIGGAAVEITQGNLILNNAQQIRWWNAAHSASYPILSLDASNQVQLTPPAGSAVKVGGPVILPNNVYLQGYQTDGATTQNLIGVGTDNSISLGQGLARVTALGSHATLTLESPGRPMRGRVSQNAGNDATYLTVNYSQGATTTQDNPAFPSWALAVAPVDDAFRVSRSPAGSVTRTTLFDINATGVITISQNAQIQGTSGRWIAYDRSSDATVLYAHNCNAKFNESGGSTTFAGTVGVSTLTASADVIAYANLHTANNVFRISVGPYTFPDFVFEHHYTGHIEQFAAAEGAKSYPGLWPLAEVEQYTREHWRLPHHSRDERRPLFTAADEMLAEHERTYLYLFDLNRRLASLERERGQ